MFNSQLSFICNSLYVFTPLLITMLSQRRSQSGSRPAFPESIMVHGTQFYSITFFPSSEYLYLGTSPCKLLALHL